MINMIAVPGFATDRKALDQRYAGVRVKTFLSVYIEQDI